MDVSYTSTALGWGVPLEMLEVEVGSICKLRADFWPLRLELCHDGWEARGMVSKTQSYRTLGALALAPVGILGALLIFNRLEKTLNAAFGRGF